MCERENVCVCVCVCICVCESESVCCCVSEIEYECMGMKARNVYGRQKYFKHVSVRFVCISFPITVPQTTCNQEPEEVWLWHLNNWKLNSFLLCTRTQV